MAFRGQDVTCILLSLCCLLHMMVSKSAFIKYFMGCLGQFQSSPGREMNSFFRLLTKVPPSIHREYTKQVMGQCIQATKKRLDTVTATIRSERCLEFITNTTVDYRMSHGLMGSKSECDAFCLLLPDHADNTSLALTLSVSDKPYPH